MSNVPMSGQSNQMPSFITIIDDLRDLIVLCDDPQSGYCSTCLPSDQPSDQMVDGTDDSRDCRLSLMKQGSSVRNDQRFE
jgi:hypothetical protein